MGRIFMIIVFAISSFTTWAQKLSYPHDVHYISLNIDSQRVRMAYMDVQAKTQPTGTVLLLHGKNFNGYYWKDVIGFLTGKGYRVVVPDQLGFGKSDKPEIQYSFSLLAANTATLLDSLGIDKVIVIAHSMGGMLATRFAVMYPDKLEKLIYENPIGFEDYSLFVPFRPVDEQYKQELKSDFESLKKYQQSYYPRWKPEYDQFVVAQYESMQIPDFHSAAKASALTYDMIYEQPQLYQFKKILKPVLLIIGQEDRTIVGKTLLSKEEALHHGQYPGLGRWAKQQFQNAMLVELPGVGHIPHIQAPEQFQKAVADFLK